MRELSRTAPATRAQRRPASPRAHPAEPTTERIPGSDGQTVPFFDADADDSGRVHVAWRALDGAVTYVRREPSGVWGAPRVLGGAGRVFVRASGPRVWVLVLAEGLLVHASTDGGETWTTTPHFPGYLAYDGAVACLDGGALVVAMVGWQVPLGRAAGSERRVGHGWAPPAPYPGRSSRQRLDLVAVRSRNDGATWSGPHPIAELERLDPERGVGMVSGQALRLSVVPRGDGTAGQDLYLSLSQLGWTTSGMRFARSTDGGAAWSSLVPLVFHGSTKQFSTSMEAADVVGRPDGVALFLTASGGAALARGVPSPDTLPPSEWRETHVWPVPGMHRHPARALSRPDGATVVVWNDERRARRTWWADTVLAGLAGWSGVWVQRDLFAAEWRASGEATPPRPVTPRGSQVWEASRLFPVGTRVGVVWRGATVSQRHGWHPMRLHLSCLTPS